MQFIDKMGVTTSVFVLQARREKIQGCFQGAVELLWQLKSIGWMITTSTVSIQKWLSNSYHQFPEKTNENVWRIGFIKILMIEHN